MEWTVDQLQSLQSIEQWKIDCTIKGKNLSDEDRFYVLEGAAGTGKSTVVVEILKVFHGYKIAVAAPTHTAKEVISEMTGRPGLTVHTLLGLRPDLDLAKYNPNNPTYSTQSKEQIGDYDLIVIDEGSMINKSLNSKIRQKAVEYGVLILLIGDSYQLPPVGERLSDVFKYRNKSMLREVVRQKHSSPNQQLLLDARSDIENKSDIVNTVFNKEFEDINSFNDYNKVQGVISTSDQDAFYSKLIELYSDSEAKTNNKFIKTLAFTNAAVEKLNKFIKHRINPSEELISEGDHLLCYKGFMEGKKMVIQNGTTYFIHHLEIVHKKVSMRLYKFYNLMIDTEGKTISILHPDSYADFHTMLEHLFNNAQDNRAWRPYYRFKEQFIVMTAFVHSERIDGYGKSEKLCAKDIDLGYAQTVHKSQGSTYENVAMIYDNFNICSEADDRRRLKYVALSRTKYLNLVYINPKKRR